MGYSMFKPPELRELCRLLRVRDFSWKPLTVGDSIKPLPAIGLFTAADLLCIIAVLAILLLCA